MPHLPRWIERVQDGAATQCLDWRMFFGEHLWVHQWHHPGEMKQFHVVFRVRAERNGKLLFWDDDGCIIRRGGQIVHEDRHVHALERHELAVAAGDTLEIAQWQFHGEWQWAARIEASPPSFERDLALFQPFLDDVRNALRRPNGPMLKTYFAATHPVRAALAVYSLILNGYRPAGVQIYGDYQWDNARARAVEALFSFAEIVPARSVMAAVNQLDPRVAPLARSVWSAMKLCVGLLHPPYEYCFVDDDVFVVDRMDDALELFEDHDLVYQTDWNHDENYRRVWPDVRGTSLKTGNINTGICFVRNGRDRRLQAIRMARNPPNGQPVWLWEQGFVATEFADARTAALSTQRYFYPIFDGLPGGVLGYDWATNPCGFATAHFGGLQQKPGDDDARILARDILGRHRTREM